MADNTNVKYKQTARILYGGHDHKDAYVVLHNMDEKSNITEYHAQYYNGSFYGKTGKLSYINSIYINTKDKFGRIKQAWRKLYDNIIKKDKVYFTTCLTYDYRLDSVSDMMRYHSTMLVTTDPKHVEHISFDRHFRDREFYDYMYGKDSEEGIGTYDSLFYDQGFDHFAFASMNYTYRGKNFDILIADYYGMYTHYQIIDASPIVEPYLYNTPEYGERKGRAYFPILMTTNGIQYYNLISLMKKKKDNGFADIAGGRLRKFWVVDNGFYVEFNLAVLDDRGREVAGDGAMCYIPVDYVNHKTGKIVYISPEKYKKFSGRYPEHPEGSLSQQITVTIGDSLANCFVEMWDEKVPSPYGGTYELRHMRRVWFVLDKHGNITTHHGLWDNDIYFADDGFIPADGKTYMLQRYSITNIYVMDTSGNYKKISETDVLNNLTYEITDNGDGSFSIYSVIYETHDSRDYPVFDRVITTRDFINFESMTVVNPVIIIPIPDRQKSLRIFLNEYIMEQEKSSESYNNYYNVKMRYDYGEELPNNGFYKYHPHHTSNLRAHGQSCFFYKNNKPCGFSGFHGSLCIGDGERVWYYLVFIGDTTLFTTSPKNFVINWGVYEQYPSVWNPETTTDMERFIDQTLLNRVNGLPYEYYPYEGG